MLTGELKSCLRQAFQQARAARHELLTTEHLLLGMLEAPAVRALLRRCGADAERLAAELRPQAEANTVPLLPGEARPTLPQHAVERVLQRAVYQVTAAGRTDVGALHVLVAIFGEPHSHAALLLERSGVTRQAVLDELAGASPQA